ncbi:MAG: NTP transferase domain-containing protein [Thermoplasmata archaeon]
MFGVVMAGGKSTRIGVEKPILEFKGKKFLDISCEAIVKSGLNCAVAVSENAPKTIEYAKTRYEILKTPGKDYCSDVKFIFDLLKEPFLTVVSDIPFVTYIDILEFMNDYKGKSMAGVVIKNGNMEYVGINIVSNDIDDEIHVFKNDLLLMNVNTWEDYKKILEKI